MKVISNNIFTKRFPHLDIHGETYATADIIIKDFINDNIKMKNKNIVIVHGKGSGVLKQKVHNILAKDHRIASFKLDNYNLGCTIIELKIELKIDKKS